MLYAQRDDGHAFGDHSRPCITLLSVETIRRVQLEGPSALDEKHQITEEENARRHTVTWDAVIPRIKHRVDDGDGILNPATLQAGSLLRLADTVKCTHHEGYYMAEFDVLRKRLRFTGLPRWLLEICSRISSIPVLIVAL